MSNKIDVIIDGNTKRSLVIMADVHFTITGEQDVADVLAKALTEQLRNKVASLTTGKFMLRAYCTLSEPVDGTDKP
jgi:hypothetical protein